MLSPDQARKVILVIDGQGGGIGSNIIKAVRAEISDQHPIWAVGTNSTATTKMMKAGANRGATGENALLVTVKKADVILGTISIVLANSMMGEVTPKMAEAISSAPAPKILLPLTQEEVFLVGSSREPLPHLIDEMIERLKEVMQIV